MLIVCPSCDTSYDVEPASLLPEGRHVRCLRCRLVWHAEPSHADKLLAAAAALCPEIILVDRALAAQAQASQPELPAQAVADIACSNGCTGGLRDHEQPVEGASFLVAADDEQAAEGGSILVAADDEQAADDGLVLVAPDDVPAADDGLVAAAGGDLQPAEDGSFLEAADDEQPAEDGSFLEAADDEQAAEDGSFLEVAYDVPAAEDGS